MRNYGGKRTVAGKGWHDEGPAGVAGTREENQRVKWKRAYRADVVGFTSLARAGGARSEWMPYRGRAHIRRGEEEEEEEEEQEEAEAAAGLIAGREASSSERLPSITTVMGGHVLSLVDLSSAVVACHVDKFTWQLDILPPEIGLMVWREVVKRPERVSLSVLQAFARAFWRPCHVDLSGCAGLIYPSPKSLRHLEAVSTSLVRLNLSACAWLQDLSFLKLLINLQCLNLRDCFQLNGSHLADLQELQELRCLNLENVYGIDDMYAAFYLPRVPNLMAVNLSGTAIGDLLIETATYGLRLKNWSERSQRVQTSKAGGDAAQLGEHFRCRDQACAVRVGGPGMGPGYLSEDCVGTKGVSSASLFSSGNLQQHSHRNESNEMEDHHHGVMACSERRGSLADLQGNAESCGVRSDSGASSFEGWPICNWKYLSVKRTRVTNAIVSHLRSRA
ncbi:hypothetical protein CBR_g49577 [Chara braunii]|uniref:Uncharacterized protein n=1 Tax=Chara braunii TaxID=69332 RepID=A0A388M5D9_CHABU|nr:hypothetical protein CBR_g49577 [Chara braunii]|eukprot:GBG89725.1 hypothetical protein CBR_g49577 [Chara braunii]